MYKLAHFCLHSSGGNGYKSWTRATTTLSNYQPPTSSHALHQQRTLSLNNLDEEKKLLNSLQTMRSMPVRSFMGGGGPNMSTRLLYAAPLSVQPYLRLMRFDKPIGTWLLYIPCAYSIVFATPLGQLPSFYHLALFGAGSFLMRSAGCVINDLWDKDLDKLVERTKNRPIASGEVSSIKAVGLLAALLTPSLAILLSLNLTCIGIGVLSMIPVVMYPLAKRVTHFPQLVLGLTFNIGAIMGYAAVTETLNLPLTMLLYLSCISWTLHYDTIYALQDVEDDRKAGIKSLARYFLDDHDNDPRRMTTDRVLDAYDRRRKMIGFLMVTCATHYTLLYTACYMKEVPEAITLPIAAACIYCLFSATRFTDPYTVKSCYGEYFNRMAPLAAAVVVFLVFEIFRSQAQKPKGDPMREMLDKLKLMEEPTRISTRES